MVPHRARYYFRLNDNDGPRVSPLGYHKIREDDKGDQPSGGNTGATRSGRGQHNAG